MHTRTHAHTHFSGSLKWGCEQGRRLRNPSPGLWGTCTNYETFSDVMQLKWTRMTLEHFISVLSFSASDGAFHDTFCECPMSLFPGLTWEAGLCDTLQCRPRCNDHFLSLCSWQSVIGAQLPWVFWALEWVIKMFSWLKRAVYVFFLGPHLCLLDHWYWEASLNVLSCMPPKLNVEVATRELFW